MDEESRFWLLVTALATMVAAGFMLILLLELTSRTVSAHHQRCADLCGSGYRIENGCICLEATTAAEDH